MYTCEQCGYTTDIKSNYTRHLNRKTSCVPVPPVPAAAAAAATSTASATATAAAAAEPGASSPQKSKGRLFTALVYSAGFTLASFFVVRKKNARAKNDDRPCFYYVHDVTSSTS